MVAGVRGRGTDGQLQFNEDQASVWEEEDALEVDGGDSGATIWKHLTCLNGTLRDSKHGRAQVTCV